MEPAFYIHIKKRFIRIAHDDIYYIESVSHHSRIHTKHGVYLPHISLKRLETVLPLDRFARINRGVLVNLGRVKHFDSDSLTFLSEKETTVSFSDKFRIALKTRITIVMQEDVQLAAESVT